MKPTIDETMSEENKEDQTPGKFCWHELLSADPEASTGFYSGLFGWTSEEMDMGPMKYTFFKNGDDPVAGMLKITEEMEGVPPHWLSYITVEDIASSVAKAKALGGRVCKDVTELPMGKFAIVIDPGGAGFALWEYGGSCES